MIAPLVVPSSSSSSVSKLRTESALLVRTDCSLRRVERDTIDGGYPDDIVVLKALDCAVETETAIEDVVDSESHVDGKVQISESGKLYCRAVKRSWKSGLFGLCQLFSWISFSGCCDEHAAKVDGATAALSTAPFSAWVSELEMGMVNLSMKALI